MKKPAAKKETEVPMESHWKAGFVLGLGLLLLGPIQVRAAGQKNGPARVALLAGQNADVARNLQDLSAVKLSGAKNVVLLERAAIDRVLTEQKLSLSGLADAATAVKAGKILAVDLLGIITAAADAKQNLGLVVFDAASGVRLLDIGFLTSDLEEQARAAAEGIQSAVGKWRAGTKNLKTVCFLPVRNGDLPRHMDPFAEALAATLERQLLHHPDIATLERKHLEGVIKEKGLAAEAATRELLASVLLVELEIGRSADGKGVRATVVLRHHSGKELKTIAQTTQDPSGAGLLEPLTQRLQEALKTAQGKGSARPDQEARRFLREAQILWHHRHYQTALRAAEAAYALHSSNQVRLLLVNYYLAFAREALKPGILAAGREHFQPFQASPEKVRATLDLIRRGFQLLDSAKTDILGFPVDTRALHDLLYLKVQPADPQTEADVRAIRHEGLGRHLERIRELARREGTQGLDRFTRILHDYAMDSLQDLAGDGTTAMKTVLEVLGIWNDLSRKMTPDDFPPLTAEILADRVLRVLYQAKYKELVYANADRESSLALLEAMQKHPHPVMKLYASYFHSKQMVKLGRLSAAEAEQGRLRLMAEAKDWIEKAPFRAPLLHRVAFYQFLDYVTKDLPIQPLARRVEAYLALAEHMLKRRDLVAGPWINAAGETMALPASRERSLQMIRQMLVMSKKGDFRIYYNPGNLLDHSLNLFQRTIELSKKHANLPWDKVIRLVEIADIKGGMVLMSPTRHENHLYVLAGGCDAGKGNQPFLQLAQAPLAGGPLRLLGKTDVTVKKHDPKKPRETFFYLPRFVTQVAIVGGRLYAGTQSDGIYAFPLSGGEPARIGDKEGLPSNEVMSLVSLADKLVALLGGGYLVIYDPSGGSCDVAVSSRRKQKLSPFDNAKSFYARNLVADADRQRVLFSVVSSRHANTGTWEYHLKTRQFKKLSPLWGYQFSGLQKDALYLQGVLQGVPWLGRLDLATNKFRLLQGKNPSGIETQKPAGLPAGFEAVFPDRLYHAGYLWEPNPFRRKPIQDGKDEFLPGVRPGSISMYLECLETVNPNQLLIGNWRGVYLLRLQGEKSP